MPCGQVYVGVQGGRSRSRHDPGRPSRPGRSAGAIRCRMGARLDLIGSVRHAFWDLIRWPHHVPSIKH
jgi:hypothetical protein